MTPMAETTYEGRLLHKAIEELTALVARQQAEIEAFKVERDLWRNQEFAPLKRHVNTMQCEINTLRTARP